MKKANYKLLGFFAAVFAIVSVNVISPMQVKAAYNDYTVTITGTPGSKVKVTGDSRFGEADYEKEFTASGTQSISGSAFKITFNPANTAIVAKYDGKYYIDADVSSETTSRNISVTFEPRYRNIAITGGTIQPDGYFLVNNAKVKLTYDGGTSPAQTTGMYTSVDKHVDVVLSMVLPSGVTATYTTDSGGSNTYTGPVKLSGDVTSITVTTTGGAYPFTISGLSTETQTGQTLKLLGGQIVLYQNNLPLTCSSCTGGVATYYLPNYNNLSIYMVSSAIGTSATGSIVGQVSTDGGINYVNIATNQFYQLPNSTTRLAVRFGTGTVTPGSTGADTKVHINFKGLVGAGISTDLKTITVPGGKVTMKASSIDQQFGHVDLNGDTRVTVSSGSKVDITLTPNSGYTAQYKIGNGAFVTGNTISITPTSDQTITIQFVSSAPAKTTVNKDKVPKTGIFHNYVMIFGILALVVAICVAGVVIYFKKNDKEKEKTR